MHRVAVSVAARVPPELKNSAFRGTWAVRQGLLTPNELRGPAWRRLFKDVYVDSTLPLTHQLRARAAAAYVVPGSVVTGVSAAALWGVDLAGADDAVELTSSPGTHPRRVPGLRVRRAVLPAELVERRRGVRVTTPEATAVRLAASLPDDDGVVAVDRLVASGLVASGMVDLEPIRALAAAQAGAGSVRARAVCALADGRAQSRQETRLRLLMRRSGLSAPVARFVVRVDGRFVARADFGWPDRRVAVEYDGLWHAEEGQFARGRQRLNRLHAAGWRVVFVTAADLHHPEEVIARIAAVLAA